MVNLKFLWIYLNLDMMKNSVNLNNTRWLILMAGVLLLGLGIWVILCPFESYLSMSLILAVFIMVTGLLEIVFSLINFKYIEQWGWILLSGLIDFSVGGYLLLYPLITMAVLPIVVGLWLLFRAFSTMLSALELRKIRAVNWGWFLTAGVLLVIVSVIILTNPVFGIINLVYFTGTALILTGIFRILLGWNLPGLGSKTIINPKLSATDQNKDPLEY